MNTPSQTRRRRIVPWIVLAVVLVAIAAFAIPYLYINVISPKAPAPFAATTAGVAPSTPVTEPTATTSATPSTPAADGEANADAEGTWQVAEGSQAGYRVEEVLNGQDRTVVGRTDGVSGGVTIADGKLTEAEIVVEMAGVKTDSGARDGQFNDSIMETGRFPQARFEATEPVALGAAGAAVKLPGTLTLKDRTVPVTATATFTGTVADGVQAVGQIPITFADWGIEAPNLGFVKVEPTGTVEFSLTLKHD